MCTRVCKNIPKVQWNFTVYWRKSHGILDLRNRGLCKLQPMEQSQLNMIVYVSYVTSSLLSKFTDKITQSNP